MSPTCPPRFGKKRPLPSNGALNILQLWASGGRTREPNLMKFGTKQHVRTTMTVTWSNIKIFKIQNGGRSLLESIRNAITRLQMDRLGCNLGGRIPLCSQYWKCYNSSYDGTDLYATPLLQNRFLGIWSFLLTPQWTFWFYLVSRSKTSTILMKLGWLCHCDTKNI